MSLVSIAAVGQVLRRDDRFSLMWVPDLAAAFRVPCPVARDRDRRRDRDP